MRRVAVRTVAVEEELSADCSLHEQGCTEMSHRAAQLEEEQSKRERRAAGCTDSDRAEQLAREALGRRGRSGGRSACGHPLLFCARAWSAAARAEHGDVDVKNQAEQDSTRHSGRIFSDLVSIFRLHVSWNYIYRNP